MVSEKKRRIVFLHPDLGIGGAERLVIDAAVGLQNLGHKVTIFTSHCDPSHCFEEARDGTLDVRVRGNSLIPPSILSRFSILCAILRQLHLIVHIALFTTELRDLAPDAFFIDQLSAGIPLLHLLSPGTRILFYCHFPDKLLARRQGLLKRLYRVPFDWIESWTTGASDVIVVNSKFTRSVFADAFPGLRHRRPAVVYPCVDVGDEGQDNGPAQEATPQQLWSGKKVILSINRFERKKDVGLALEAFAQLPEALRKGARLVIAGGYDPRVAENVQYHRELDALASSLELEAATATSLITALSLPASIDVLFLLSVPSSLKATLLHAATLLVYTPPSEHFGIVPLEAMLARVPVLAASEGGPTETVVDGATGWLRDARAAPQWSAVMEDVLRTSAYEQGRARLGAMGAAGRARVVATFSKTEMGRRLDDVLQAMMNLERRPPLWSADGLSASIVAGVVAGMLTVFIARWWLLS